MFNTTYFQNLGRTPLSYTILIVPFEFLPKIGAVGLMAEVPTFVWTPRSAKLIITYLLCHIHNLIKKNAIL
jgi:hypothetical protein